MSKLDDFKEFVKDKSFLKEKVNRGETTWQKLYETYDLFGEDADDFKEERSNEKSASNLLKMLEGVNLEKISENLEGMKKILGVLGEFSKKDEVKTSHRSFRTSRRDDD